MAPRETTDGGRGAPSGAERAAATVRERVLLRGRPEYPAALLDLPDPPDRLHVRGAGWPLPRAVALVGSRAASPYGLTRTAELAADLARLGFTVVSGLAHGVDAAAHRAALACGGATIAVLPAGLDSVTPVAHGSLAREIASRGALVSEHPRGTPTHRGSFVRRNRLIAALARAVVVVEAAERSGTLSTAAAARRIGRPVLAVPGDVDRPTSRGCHALLRSGAAGWCETAADVVAAASASAREPWDADDRLRRALSPEGAPLEVLARAAGLSPSVALARLLALEWAGVARGGPGQRWGRVER